MMNGKLTKSQTSRTPHVSKSIAAIALALLATAGASGQEWPFSDAPEPITGDIQQTSGSSGAYLESANSGGVIMSAGELDLGPGETVIGGDPVLRQSGIIDDGRSQIGSKIPYRTLHHSGRGPQRRTRGSKRFGPRECQECMWGCPQGCAPTAYGGLEALAIQYDKDPFNYSRNRFDVLSDDFELGVRVTFGRMCNCSDGYEFTYTGMLEWEHTGYREDPTGQLNIGPTPNPPLMESDFPGFYGTITQSHRFKSRFNSYEVNHREWGWDVISTVAGVRVIDYNEDFAFRSENNVGDIGRFNLDVNNLMIGGQLGLDMLYPVCRRIMIGSRIRGSLMANLFETQTDLTDSSIVDANNRVIPIIRDTDDDYKLAGLVEAGFFVSYHFLPCLSVKAGYEGWYLMNAATARDRIQSTIGGGFSSRSTTSDIYFNGATASVEVLF